MLEVFKVVGKPLDPLLFTMVVRYRSPFLNNMGALPELNGSIAIKKGQGLSKLTITKITTR